MRTINITYTSPQALHALIIENDLKNHTHLLLQVFTGICDITYIQNLVDTIKEMLPHIKIIGTTTSGEIIDGKAQDNTTVLSFSIFDKTEIQTYITEVTSDSQETAENLISQFTKADPTVAIVFADGLCVNGEEFINTFVTYDENLIIAGGMAADNADFKQTIVFTEKRVVSPGVVTALLYNKQLHVATKASFGWESIGKRMTITRAEKNRVYEIDGQRAVEIYAKYLGEDIAYHLPQVGVEFPLIVKKNGMEIPRAVVVKKRDGSLVFSGNIKEGEKVTFGYGNLHSILQYGQNIYDDKRIWKSESIFVYSCMARKQLLGENVNDELLPLQNICNVSGFFTYGEFYVESQYHNHELLNETMTVLALSEDMHAAHAPHTQYDYFQKNRSDEQNLTLKALSHLISQTSKELEELNTMLRERVMEEVIKNNRKDRVMLQQTKLAQMGEMISMIAHQWRQPLSAISTLSQTINLKASLGALDEETALRLSDTITATAMHLSQTIDDFREFFKPRKEKQETSYCEIIEGVLSIIETSIVTKNIQIIKDLQCKRKFNSYPNEIKQVVLNLIKNAQDALIESKVENPYILIRTYKRNGSRILEIEDNAGGVPEALKSKIFEPYFSTKEKKDGTGLGLYMSKTIIEEHCHGILSIRNSSKGAIFRVELPVVDEGEEHS